MSNQFPYSQDDNVASSAPRVYQFPFDPQIAANVSITPSTVISVTVVASTRSDMWSWPGEIMRYYEVNNLGPMPDIFYTETEVGPGEGGEVRMHKWHYYRHIPALTGAPDAQFPTPITMQVQAGILDQIMFYGGLGIKSWAFA